MAVREERGRGVRGGGALRASFYLLGEGRLREELLRLVEELVVQKVAEQAVKEGRLAGRVVMERRGAVGGEEGRAERRELPARLEGPRRVKVDALGDRVEGGAPLEEAMRSISCSAHGIAAVDLPVSRRRRSARSATSSSLSGSFAGGFFSTGFSFSLFSFSASFFSLSPASAAAFFAFSSFSFFSASSSGGIADAATSSADGCGSDASSSASGPFSGVAAGT